MLVKADFNNLLSEKGIFPIINNWNTFLIQHCKPNSIEEQKKIREKIKKEVGKKNGLYAYYSLNGDLLYIGKAKPLSNRLLSHYRESYEPVPGDTRTKRWHRFFMNYQGKLQVCWIEMEDEKTRRIVEQMLDYILEPKFNSFY